MIHESKLNYWLKNYIGIKMKKEYKILAILFLLALIIRIVFLFASPVKIWDETVYANLGYDLSKNPFDYSFAKNW